MKRALGIAIVLALMVVLVACGTQEVTLVRVEVDTSTLADTYEQGTTPDIQEARLILHYSDGSSDTVALSEATMLERWSNAIGDHTTLFEYQKLRCAYSYTVTAPAAATYRANLNGKTQYEYDEAIATEGTFVLDGTTYALADYAASMAVEGFDTTSAGTKTCTIVVQTELGEVTLTYTYQVKAPVEIERVEWAGGVQTATVGQSAPDFLAQINQTPFVIYNKDNTTEEVRATTLTDYSAAAVTDSATCHARVSNKSRRTYLVDIPYRVVRADAELTVTYYPQYGSYGPTQLAAVDGYAVQPTLSRPGWTLDGWITADGIIFDFATPLDNSISLYALWHKTQYTIRFVDGGSLGDTGLTYYIDSHVTLPDNPTKAGCTFLRYEWKGQTIPLNWTPDPNTEPEDMALTVVWDHDEYDIVYKLKATTLYPVTNNNPDTYLAYQVVDLVDPVRDGYIFDGWTTTDSDSANRVQQVGQGIGKVTLYAHWLAKDYRLTTINAATGDTIATRTIKPSENTTLVQAPTLENYRFEGWYYDEDCQQVLSQKEDKYYLPAGIKKDMTIYARTARVYTLYLDKGYDEEGAERIVTVRFAVGDETNEQQRLAYCNLWQKTSRRFGCDMATWRYNDLVVTVGETPSVATQDLAAYDGATLVAQWTGHTHYIYCHYNWANSGNEIVVLSYNTLDTVVYPANPSRPGYDFNGWTKRDDANAQRVTGFGPCDYDEDLHIYAQWTAK